MPCTPLVIRKLFEIVGWDILGVIGLENSAVKVLWAHSREIRKIIGGTWRVHG